MTHAARKLPSPLVRWRKRAGAAVVDGFFRGISSAGRALPQARPERHRVELIADVPYLQSGHKEHLLDIYRPLAHRPPLPVVLYVHGGGFRILSKDSHWLMGLIFARRGYLVFNASYRLAPRHRYPSAVEDVAAALAWVRAHAAEYGGDLSRLVLAGESAGANLVTSLALATSYRRPEPFAEQVFELGLAPRAVVPACGVFQVSDPERFSRRKPKLPRVIQDRLSEVSEAYLGEVEAEEHRVFADPLVFLERGQQPERSLPPFFLPVGTKDPLLDDTRRLKRALDELQVPAEARYYEGELHAFHAFIWRKNARRCWGDTFDFLSRHVPAGG